MCVTSVEGLACFSVLAVREAGGLAGGAATTQSCSDVLFVMRGVWSIVMCAEKWTPLKLK